MGEGMLWLMDGQWRILVESVVTSIARKVDYIRV